MATLLVPSEPATDGSSSAGTQTTAITRAQKAANAGRHCVNIGVFSYIKYARILN